MPLGGLMKWRGGHTRDDTDRYKSYLHVHSKKDLKLKWAVEMPHPMTAYHIVDAFEEEGNGKEILLKVRVAELQSKNPECDRPLLEKQFSNQYAVPMGTRLHSTLREYTFILNSNGTGGFLDCGYIGDKIRKSIPCDYPVTNKIGSNNRVRYTWVNTLAPPDKETGNLSDWFDAVQKIDMENCILSSDPITFGDGVVRDIVNRVYSKHFLDYGSYYYILFAPTFQYCGPPLFIPKQRLVSNNANSQPCKEDNGYILVVLYMSKEHRSDIAILDSATMDILCRMELECHFTYSFHGEFIPGYVAVP
jgi:carotenoid cleavage dioxygenase-like enzyme